MPEQHEACPTTRMPLRGRQLKPGMPKCGDSGRRGASWLPQVRKQQEQQGQTVVGAQADLRVYCCDAGGGRDRVEPRAHGLVRGDAPGHDQRAQPRHGLLRPCEAPRDALREVLHGDALERGGDVGADGGGRAARVGLAVVPGRAAVLQREEDAGLEAGVGEVAGGFGLHWHGEGDGVWVASLGKRLERRPAARHCVEAEHAGDLVEGLADGVVESGAHLQQRGAGGEREVAFCGGEREVAFRCTCQQCSAQWLDACAMIQSGSAVA